MNTLFTYIIVFFAIICLLYIVVIYVNNTMLFLPEDISIEEYQKFCINNANRYIPYEFMSNDKQHKLVGGLYNSYHTPSWDDQIFLFSHGNASWIGTIVKTNIIKFLSKYGSIFVYDYRGYGCNEGEPSDVGLENDALGAWKFVTNRVNKSKLIIVGHSLGCGVSCRMLANIAKNKPTDLPDNLILNAPFKSVKDMALHLLPSLAWLSVYEFDNVENGLLFNDKVNICILHSKSDDVIPYSQAKILANLLKCTFFEITGGHSDQYYPKELSEYIQKISKHS